MGILNVSGFNEVSAAFDKLKDASQDLQREAVKKGADIIVKSIKKSADTMGIVDTGQTRDSIQAQEPVSSHAGVYVMVKPMGYRKAGKRKKETTNAEVAFLNEYGVPSKKIAARPFMQKAVEDSTPELERIINDTLEAHLKKSGL